VDGGRYAGGQQRGAGGGAGVAARIQHDPDPVLVGKHGANIEFPMPTMFRFTLVSIFSCQIKGKIFKSKTKIPQKIMKNCIV
jgi:hypothetical protein